MPDTGIIYPGGGGVPQPLAAGSTPTFAGLTLVGSGFLSLPDVAPSQNRGFIFSLGKLTGLNLNAVAATTIFQVPAGGLTRCIVTELILDNFSIAATTASVSYGSSTTPTDFLATATMPGAATTKAISLFPASNAAYAFYGQAVFFVANVTIAQGAAATCDVRALGYFE